jgi:hypothetical protein
MGSNMQRDRQTDQAGRPVAAAVWILVAIAAWVGILATPGAALAQPNPAQALDTTEAADLGGDPFDVAPPAGWLNPVEVDRALKHSVSVSYQGRTLRDALQQIGFLQRIPHVLDRRIDPSTPLDVTLRDTPLEDALTEIAAAADASYCIMSGVLYVGPREAVSQLRTVAALRRQEAAQLSGELRRRLFAKNAFHWEDFASPRDLAKRVAEEAGITLEHAEAIPHDLWAGADLPPLACCDRLTLVAHQWGLTFRLSREDGRAELIPIPDDVAIERSYPGGSDPKRRAERFRERAPEATVDVVNKKIRVRARLEDHEQLAGPTDLPRRRPAKPDGKKVYQLTLKDVPLGAVLDKVAEQAGFKLEVDSAALDKAGISLSQRISVQVQDATLDELLAAILKGTDLTFEREEGTVRIEPAD